MNEQTKTNLESHIAGPEINQVEVALLAKANEMRQAELQLIDETCTICSESPLI